MAGPEQAPPSSWSMAGVAAWVAWYTPDWAFASAVTAVVCSIPDIALMPVVRVAAPIMSWWSRTATAARSATAAAHAQGSTLPRGLIRRCVAAVIAFPIRFVDQDRHYTGEGYRVSLRDVLSRIRDSLS